MILNINYKSRIMNSKKIYIKSKYQDILIPLMSVPISNARSKDNPFEFFLYDTSGEHGLPVNLNRKNHNGINKLRLEWINNRKDTIKTENGSLIANKLNNVSQMHYAKQGIITKSILSIKVISIVKFLKNTPQNLLGMK